MKDRRYRQRPIQVNVTLSDGTPRCPFCNKSFDHALPFIGKRGVSLAIFHEHQEGYAMHYDTSVMAHVDNDVDYDDECAYEIGGKDEMCTDGIR